MTGRLPASAMWSLHFSSSDRHLAFSAVEMQGEPASVVDQPERLPGWRGTFLVDGAEPQFVPDAVFGAHEFSAPGVGYLECIIRAACPQGSINRA